MTNFKFSDIPEKDHKEILKDSVHKANEEQRKFMQGNMFDRFDDEFYMNGYRSLTLFEEGYPRPIKGEVKQFIKQELLTIIKGTIWKKKKCILCGTHPGECDCSADNYRRNELINFYKEQGYQSLLDELNIK